MVFCSKFQIISTKDKQPNQLIDAVKKIKPSGKSDPVPSIAKEVEKVVKDAKISVPKVPNFVNVILPQDRSDPKKVSKDIEGLSKVCDIFITVSVL